MLRIKASTEQHGCYPVGKTSALLALPTLTAKYMNKLKYLTAMLIAIAGFGFQQAQATFEPGQEFTVPHPLGPPSAERAYLLANGYIDECCQVAGKFEGAGSNQFFTVTVIDASHWQVSWDFTGTNFTFCGALIKDGAVEGQQLYSFFGVTSDELVQGSGIVSFSNLRGISHITLFAGPCAGVPDGGATVMLLGAALGSLGMARRFLKR
jgi:hypothetical protein